MSIYQAKTEIPAAAVSTKPAEPFFRPVIQPALSINAPGDKYEQEADSMADHVMRSIQHPGSQPAISPFFSGSMQRKCANCQEEEKLQRQTAEQEDDIQQMPLMRQEEGGGYTASQQLSDQISNTKGGGQSLPSDTRAHMETAFGSDFSQVRIHADSQAINMSRGIQAKAFTHGANIYFNQGQYAPGSGEGKKLLAHELTHVVQQGHSQPHISKKESTPAPEEDAGAIMEESNVAPLQATSPGIQRSYCPAPCETSAGAGNLCRSGRITRDNCDSRGASSDSNKISHIRVLLDTKEAHLFWNGAPDTDTGTKEVIECTPNSRRTPTGRDVIGVKCGMNHTSYERYNMAYFTALKSTGYRIGFHNSQPVGSGYRSHGCIRVSCENALKINENTASDWTSVRIRNSQPGD